MHRSRFFLLVVLLLSLPSLLSAQSEQTVLVDVPVGGDYVLTVPADWFMWSGEPVVTAEQEERALLSSNILVQSVYPSLFIPSRFARRYRQFIGVPSSPPEEGVVYVLVEIIPVADLMLAVNNNESVTTTAGLLRTLSAQVLTSQAVNGRTASFGVTRTDNSASILAAYRFATEGRLALVSIVAPDEWVADNVALVRLLATTLRREGEPIDEAAYEEFAGEPIPEVFRLPSEGPLPVPTFDLTGGFPTFPEVTPDTRILDSGILPTPTFVGLPPTAVPTPRPPAPVIPQPPPVVPSVPPAQPVPGGQVDATGRCITPEGWRQYVVQPGDTLFRVAVAFGSSIAALRDGNCIRNVDFLPWGTIIYVPGSPGVTGSASGGGSNPPAPVPAGLFRQGCTDPSTVITAPFVGQQIAGGFTISGTASLPNMNYYKIEIRPDFSAVFNYVGQSSDPVTNGTLARLDSRSFGTGTHWIRLTVVDDTGNFPTPCTVPVVFR